MPQGRKSFAKSKKEVTASFIIDGQLYSKTFNVGELSVPTDAAFNESMYFYSIPEAPFILRLRNLSSVNLVAAKLEVGNSQTLAHQDENGEWVLNDSPPSIAQELAKCQRYSLVLRNIAGIGVPYSATDFRFLVPTPVTMRIQPTITYTGEWRVSSIFSTGGDGVVTSMGVMMPGSNCVVISPGVSSSGVVYRTYVVLANNIKDSKIILDSNL